MPLNNNYYYFFFPTPCFSPHIQSLLKLVAYFGFIYDTLWSVLIKSWLNHNWLNFPNSSFVMWTAW